MYINYYEMCAMKAVSEGLSRSSLTHVYLARNEMFERSNKI